MRQPLVMTLLVRNEADILRENLHYHLEQGVDHFIVTANCSDDPTLKIIREFSDRNLATLIEEPSDDYQQARWVTRMAQLAATRFRAKWVINSDADEFWHSPIGNLGAFFRRQNFFTATVVANRHDFIARDLPERRFFETMHFRKAVSNNALGQPLPPKVAHRAHRSTKVLEGNHGVDSPRLGFTSNQRLEIWHFPIRNRKQYTKKIRDGTEALLRNKTAHPSTCDAWRRQYHELITTGKITYLETQILSDETISAQLKSGELISDFRLRDTLRQIFKTR